MTQQRFALGSILLRQDPPGLIRSGDNPVKNVKPTENNELLPNVAGCLGVAVPQGGPLAAPDLPPLPDNWHPRDQGRYRGTCNAFACVSMLELQRYWADPAQPVTEYSEEFVYTKMRTEYAPVANAPMGYELGATLLSQAGACLGRDGVCLRQSLKYDASKTNDKGVWLAEVDSDHETEAENHKVTGFLFGHVFLPDPADRPVDGLSSSLHLALSAGLPPVVSLPVHPVGRASYWEIGRGWDWGVIPHPNPDGTATLKSGALGHTVCLVGYQPNEDPETGGWFIFRNSWGRRFSRNAPETHGMIPSVPAAGYGAISTQHIDDYAWEALFMFPQ